MSSALYIFSRKKRRGIARLNYAAASSMFSMKMPYPVVGSLTRTWVTAPTSLPSWIIGLPDTLMSSVGQKNFVFFCRFYAFLQAKGRLWHTSSAIPQLTWMNCWNQSLLNFLSLSTNSDFRGCASVFTLRGVKSADCCWQPARSMCLWDYSLRKYFCQTSAYRVAHFTVVIWE